MHKTDSNLVLMQQTTIMKEASLLLHLVCMCIEVENVVCSIKLQRISNASTACGCKSERKVYIVKFVLISLPF